MYRTLTACCNSEQGDFPAKLLMDERWRAQAQLGARICPRFDASILIKHLQPDAHLSLAQIYLCKALSSSWFCMLVGGDMKNEMYILVLVGAVEGKMDLNSEFPAESWVWSYLSFTSALEKSSAFWFLILFFSFWGFWFHLALHWQWLQEPRKEDESEWRHIIKQLSSGAFWSVQSLLSDWPDRPLLAWNSHVR